MLLNSQQPIINIYSDPWWVTLVITVVGSLAGVLAGAWISMRTHKRAVREEAHYKVKIDTLQMLLKEIQALEDLYLFHDEKIVRGRESLIGIKQYIQLGYPFMKAIGGKLENLLMRCVVYTNHLAEKEETWQRFINENMNYPEFAELDETELNASFEKSYPDLISHGEQSYRHLLEKITELKEMIVEEMYAS